MDVALDSNIYLANPRMDGIGFSSLLDYLRKTESSLILPQVVLDEVIARYPARVSSQAQKAHNCVKSLNSVLLATRVNEIPNIDPAQESRAMRSKLLKPSKYVKSILLRNFRSVDVEEIARRGIHRIPPANQGGEQLRDVIIWLNAS